MTAIQILLAAVMTPTFIEIALLAYDDANAVDVFGPLQVFASANELLDAQPQNISKPRYRTRLVSLQNQLQITLATQTRVLCDTSLAELAQFSLDTLLIVGGTPATTLSQDQTLIKPLQDLLSKARRVASVCSGAFILAATGVLNGRRATTHWKRYAEFRTRFPQVQLDIDALFTHDGKYYCSAGVTAGIDLTLQLVQDDCGQPLALETARQMVAFYHRPGGQNQFSSPIKGLRELQHPALRKAQQYIHQHLDQALEVAQLADLVAMSVRNFSRQFSAATGLAPSRYIAQARLNQARWLLESSDLSIPRIAQQCGFQSSEILRRKFLQALNVAPADYRKRFSVYREDLDHAS
ncbi:GlxA family transcriptional regulator [Thiolinea disciformis]|uniref:GlxA family transcriptional regulator n=1 Tax=Thiolinea disciformis TaxID=125614 RepID=UPI0003819438|nr:GlxA family transcriptional regulator [Thiolinea disciformis]